MSGVDSLATGDDRDNSTERILPGLFIRKDTVNSNFIGLNSTGAIIAFCMRESLKSTPGLAGSVGLDFLMEGGVHVDEAGVPKSSPPGSYADQLPEKAFAGAAVEGLSFHQHLPKRGPLLTCTSFQQPSSKPSIRCIR